jgi:hypothetical protein
MILLLHVPCPIWNPAPAVFPAPDPAPVPVTLPAPAPVPVSASVPAPVSAAKRTNPVVYPCSCV